MEILSQDFYNRDTVEVARELLGCHLVRVFPDQTKLVCRITETEAYVGRMDKACHAYGYKRTPRTQTLFAPPGTAYIYLIYGMYHCLNFVTEPEGEPSAVLIRGAQVVANGDIIAENRFGCKMHQLSSAQRKHLLDGPGKLCRGLALTRAENGLSITKEDGVLYVCRGLPPLHIQVGTRIGIDYAQEAIHFPWRFWTED
ncbi:MAG: DNA-3-methyladenine glycosylase [Lawsonibacter sp.]|jgi:DNA-3-methyladenine glycosylase